MKTIGIVIPTFQGAKHLPFCLPPLLESPLKPRILIIDSSSTDETLFIAKRMGVETVVIPQSEFNHGTTREKGRKLLETDIVIMMTQDAYPTSPHTIEKLIEPLLEKKATIAYARQIPHQNASVLSAFARSFNYPSESHIRSLDDFQKYGIYTFFCSNSCAAYLNDALDEIGGFPQSLLGEDTIVVAKLLHRKHRIAYVADALIAHSHNFTLKQEFCRHFSIGLTRHSYRNLISISESDYKRGYLYAQKLLLYLFTHSPFLIPYAILHLSAKFCGYYLGKIIDYTSIYRRLFKFIDKKS